MSVKQNLYNKLITFGYPVYLQGTLNPDDAYPDTFLTYWTDDTADKSHYDDATVSYEWDFTVILYSNDPMLLETKPQEIMKTLKEAGFIPRGKGNDIPSDEVTHTGWAMDFIYLENK